MKKIYIAGVMVGLLGLAGCATRSSVDEVKQIALDAQKKAEVANKCCADTNVKLDSLFKKSMMK